MVVERRKPREELGRYRKVYVRIHGDEKYRRLSRPKPNGQSCFWYLMTNPHTTAIPGLFSVGEAGLAEELEWPLEGFRKAFGEAFREGMVKADWKARVVWLPNAIKYNEPESPNVVKSWRRHYDEIPECTLKLEALQHLKAFMEAFGEAFLQAFLEAFAEPLGKASGKALANHEHDHEHDHEHSTESPSDSLPQPRPTRLSPPPNGGGPPLVAVAAKDQAAPKGKVEAFAMLWNETTTAPLPRCRDVSASRRKKIATRLRERGMGEWLEVFQRIEASTFCRGRNDRGWKASFDWIIDNEDNATKVLEGKYDDRGSVESTPPCPRCGSPYGPCTLHDQGCLQRALQSKE